MFAQAVEHYRQGRLDEAEKLAARIRKLSPGSYDALHLIGIVKLQRGHASAALALIGAGLHVRELRPTGGSLEDVFAELTRGAASADEDEDEEARA